MRDLFNYYVHQKEWDIYLFIPPAFSLLLGLIFIPSYEKLIDARVDDVLRQYGITNDGTGNRLHLVKSVIKSRGLQIAYLTELPSFAIAIISTAQGNHPTLVAVAWVVTVVLTLFAVGNVFLRKPDWLATTQFPKKRRPEWLANFGWYQIKLYAAILPILTVILIFIIIMTLPEKKTSTTPTSLTTTSY